ncbi:MAG: hypothetical protein M0042_13265 [Nitrospiraceae bacterium]|nr:hypothetical protein [Nitrospiraceae bacterium]
MKIPFKLLVVLLFLAWMLPGTLGRDPWKADEPYSFGMVNSILRTGDMVVPAVAGEPFLEKPPLYYITASFSARFLSPLFDRPVAARMINLFWMALALVAVGLTAREVAGDRAAWTAPLYLMGCVALQIPAHKLITDVALFAGFALGFYGLAVARRSPSWGGLWLGTGAGIGFLTKGLLAPGILGLTAAVLPLQFPGWRSREYGRAVAVALAASLPWFVLWPALLYLRSPDQFIEWFWYQNFGRFLGFARAGKKDSHWFFLLNLPWLAWPVLPLAGWSLWKSRKNRESGALWQLPLSAFAIMLAVLSLSSSSREIYALPLLLPLAILASADPAPFSDRARRVTRWGIAAFFGMLGAAIWIAWFLEISGNPVISSRLPEHAVHYAPAATSLIAGALLCTAAGLLALRRSVLPSAPLLASWTSGTVLAWGLVMTLGLPWLEAESSYRDTFSSLQQALPKGSRCVASYGMGESERAMAEYYAGVRTRPLEVSSGVDCDLLIIGCGKERVDPVRSEDWQLLWQNNRPAKHPKEHFSLYRHRSSGAAPQALLTPGLFHID